MVGGVLTVSVAELLVTVPSELVTVTVYEPESLDAGELKLRLAEVAPEMAAPSLRHW
jgi:hypothetical protein